MVWGIGVGRGGDSSSVVGIAEDAAVAATVVAGARALRTNGCEEKDETPFCVFGASATSGFGADFMDEVEERGLCKY